ncbi:MAG: LysE family translocator [Actinomycetota bacterium]|nr:LysE family translocator [Actinomycetota bacterium]
MALFAVAALVVLLVPGPAVLYVATRAIEQGRVAGLASVFGVATGGFIHVVAAAVGLSATLAASALAFNVVKLTGAAYLIVLGIRRLLIAGASEEQTPQPASVRRIYVQGMVVQALNPKAALFFLAFLPQFVNPTRGVALQVVVLGALFVALGVCSDSAWALLASTAAAWLRARPGFRRRGEQVAGTVYVGLGLTAAFAGHSSPPVANDRALLLPFAAPRPFV